MDNKSILIVDDDEIFCDALSRAMQRKGFITHIATNCESAIKTAHAHNPGYALLDLRIGQESGLNLIKELLERNAEIKIVILTGYASIATAIEAIKLGAIHYLTKPADTEQITTAFSMDNGNPDVTLTEQPMSVERLEWEHIQKVLIENEGNISAAARSLGMHRRTLQRKLNKHPRKH